MKLRLILFVTLLLGAFSSNAVVEYKQFLGLLDDPKVQEFLESPRGKTMISSYKQGMPSNETEFKKFRSSITFWKLQRVPEVREYLINWKEPEEKKPEVAPTARVKTERERYLEQFMKPKKKVVEVKPTPTAIVLEADGEDELEEKLQEIQDQSEEVLKMADAAKSGDLDAVQKLAGAGMVVEGKTVNPMEHPDVAVAQMLAPYQGRDEADIEQSIREGAKGGYGGMIFKYIPKLPLFMARVIKSKDALPALAKMGLDKKRLLIYALLNVGTIILGFILKRVMATELQFSKQVKNFFIRVAVLYAIRIFLLVFFFKDELGPTAKIFMKTFF